MKNIGDDGSKIVGPLGGGPSSFTIKGIRSFDLFLRPLETAIGSKKVRISE